MASTDFSWKEVEAVLAADRVQLFFDIISMMGHG
jgi:hypothetical protein